MTPPYRVGTDPSTDSLTRSPSTDSYVRTYPQTDRERDQVERDGFLLSNARDARRALSGLGGWESHDWTSLPDKQQGPRRSSPAGWLYVVEFDFGVIKVGQSIAPRERIQRHVKDATRFDGAVVQFWLSGRHSQWMSNESLLILWCCANGRQTFGEYFADLDYDKTVAHATALVYPPKTECRLHRGQLADHCALCRSERIGAALTELERTDPEVRAAAESLARVVDSVLLRREVPRRRFHKSTEDRGVEVER